MNKNTTAAAGLVLSTTATAGLFFVGKATLATLEPVWFTLVRYAPAAAILLLLLRMAGPVRWHQFRDNLGRIAWLGLLGYALFGVLVFTGLAHSVPSHGAVIMATMPVTAMVLRSALDRQRLQWWAAAVLALTLAGVLLVSGVLLHPAGGASTLGGDLTAFAGSVGWVFYTRGQATLPQLTVLEYTAFTATMAVPALVVFALVATTLGWSHLPTLAGLAHSVPAMAYTVLFATVFAALAYNRGVRQLGVTQGIVFINLIPVSALVMSALRGVMPGVPEIVGALMVVSALLLQATLSARAVR
jgi:drug/metabolite transporter (DMT)-like permease